MTSTGETCYILEHDGGIQTLIRVPNDNTWGLDVDYDGGVCAEIVAPVGRYVGDTGNVVYLDIQDESWMRTWDME